MVTPFILQVTDSSSMQPLCLWSKILPKYCNPFQSATIQSTATSYEEALCLSFASLKSNKTPNRNTNI